jgi:nitroreductase
MRLTSAEAYEPYKNQPLPKGTVEALLEAAHLAPSAGNIQPWQFIVADKVAIKKALSHAAYEQKALGEAPIVIVVCAN